MDRDQLIGEITGPDVAAMPGAVIEMIVDMSLIAYQSLASPPRGGRADRMAEIRDAIGSRSRYPRVILRRLIEIAGERYGYVPGPEVMRAAGIAKPRTEW